MLASERGKRFFHRLEWLLWLAAILCLGIVSFAGLAALQAHRQAFAMSSSAVRESRQDGGATGSPSDIKPVRLLAHQAGDVIGRLEIPILGLSVPMTAGIETSSLLKGVGHIEGTAFPGGLGTLGLAGHRDTYFRPLRRIQIGMDIRVTDASGTYHYEVDSTEVVSPEQVDVLAIRARPELTLVTCFPFDYIGAAPKRFIVHAHLLSASPDTPAPSQR